MYHTLCDKQMVVPLVWRNVCSTIHGFCLTCYRPTNIAFSNNRVLNDVQQRLLLTDIESVWAYDLVTHDGKTSKTLAGLALVSALPVSDPESHIDEVAFRSPPHSTALEKYNALLDRKRYWTNSRILTEQSRL